MSEIKIEKIDLLEMENISLKIGIARSELQRLLSKKSDLGEHIKGKYEIDDLQRYIFDPETGIGRRIEAQKEAQGE